MKNITSKRLKELSNFGHMSNVTKIAEALQQIIDNAYSEYKNEDTYFVDSKETEIQITTHTETQENALRGLEYNYPNLVKTTFCKNLNHAHISNIDVLVREYYKSVKGE